MSILDFISDCFKIAYLYFGTIQTKIGPVVTGIIVPDRSPVRKAAAVTAVKETAVVAASSTAKDNSAGVMKDLFSKLSLDQKTSKLPPESAITLEMLEESFKDEEEASEEEEDDDEEVTEDDDDDDEEEEEEGRTFEAFIRKHGRELTPKQARRVTELVPKNMISFKFDGDILTMGQVRFEPGTLKHLRPS